MPGIVQNALNKAILAELQKGANSIAQQAKSNASRFSKTIPDAISAGDASLTDEGYEVTIRIDLIKAPQALAFEFGSGIHSTRGKVGTYEITPKKGGALAFLPWPGFEFPARPGEKMIGQSEKSKKLLLRKVDHPGVEANPYLFPALDAYAPSLGFKVLGAFSSALRNLKRRVEIIE